MAKGSDYIAGIFPDATFTGGSGIHASYSVSWQLPDLPPKEIMSVLKKIGASGYLWRHLGKMFPFPEWIISPEVFDHFLMADCWRHLNGQPDSTSNKKLKNPVTGNTFHRIALGHGLVGGIRFWCDDLGCGGPVFGFRFRIEGIDSEEEENTRERTRQETEVVLEAIEVLNEIMFDVAEPPAAVVKEAEMMFETQLKE